MLFLTRQQRSGREEITRFKTNSANPPPEITNKYLQIAEGGESILLPDFHSGDSSMQRTETSNPPNTDNVSSQSTVDLQACMCNLRRQCMSKNVVMKGKAFLICVYYPEEEGRDETRRFQHIPYMNITHSVTGTIFEPITSDYTRTGNLIATYMSPWMKVWSYDDSTFLMLRFEQLLDFWFESKGTVDFAGEVLVQTDGGVMGDNTEANPLDSDVMPRRERKEYFHLTAQLMDNPPCESSIPGSLSVSIHEGNSIVFACTCDDTHSCIDLNFDLPDESAAASMRICIIPQEGNDETVDIVRITQLRLDKEGPCGFPFDVVSDGVASPLATIEEVKGDNNPGVAMLVATIILLPPQVLNPSSITVYGTVEVQLPDFQFQEVLFGTVRNAVVADEPASLISCLCDNLNYECNADPLPLLPNELVRLCLWARPQTSEFKNGSVYVLMVQNIYKNLIVKGDVAEGVTTIPFKNETLMVIETFLDDAAFDRPLSYVEFNSFAGLDTASFSNDVTSYLRLPLRTEPNSTSSASPSLSHRPTFAGPTFEPANSNEPTEGQTIRLKYCHCDNGRKCLEDESVTLTQYERNIRICFETLPTTAQVVGTPVVESNSPISIPFTTLLDSDRDGGLITGEAPDELFEASIGSQFEVLGNFSIVEGGKNATLGLSVVYKVGSVESSAYCSSSTAQLRACACQCDDTNNCVDGLIQTLVSRGEYFRLIRIVFVLLIQLITIPILPLHRRCSSLRRHFIV